MRSGLILAGGRSTRFGGGEKSLRLVGGKRMICRVIDALCPVADELVISVRDERQKELLFPFIRGMEFVYDPIKDIGPLSGILAGLERARGDYVVVVACDMPLINTAAVRLLFERAQGHDAAVPGHAGGLIEPLHTVYHREHMLRAVKESIAAGESKISAPLMRMKDVVYVPDEEIRRVDPELETFLNVNRAEDMERIKLKK
ncbi:MAG TPA: molybdenum cofactor guanylyltransferase [Methanocella sp.]|uniref:molybdenum cofactor guanylyltransferase n=1 Tax=Methanocella sp. TaxID=2052833 RepID=UPI002C8C9E37|nr:molybdenum cofactor guanylyltransferase [Methanocella sp.]HTY90530.1 molybdenum cofactor guanylyltransferase [Methanocella sp.]